MTGKINCAFFKGTSGIGILDLDGNRVFGTYSVFGMNGMKNMVSSACAEYTFLWENFRRENPCAARQGWDVAPEVRFICSVQTILRAVLTPLPFSEQACLGNLIPLILSFLNRNKNRQNGLKEVHPK